MTRSRRNRLPAVVTILLLAGSVLAAGAVGEQIGTTGPGTRTGGDPPGDCEGRTPHPPIRITENRGPQGFAWTNPVTGGRDPRPGSGVVAGNGSSENPYVIAGWCIAHNPRRYGASLLLRNTTAHVVIEDNRIDGDPTNVSDGATTQAFGIRVDQAENVTIRDNTVTRIHPRGPYWFAWGLFLHDSDGIRIVNNTITDTGQVTTALSLADSDGATIRGNTITNNYAGLDIDSERATTGLTIRANKIADNEADAVMLRDTRGARFRDNTVTGNKFGIHVVSSNGARVVNNTITANRGHGVKVARSDRVGIHDNVIARNRWDGVRVTGNSTPVRLHGNNIRGNAGDGLSVWGGGLPLPESGPVNVTGNWWGAADGPSGGVVDDCTGAAANGSGDEIATPDPFGTDPTVCFDPWLESPNPEAGAS